MVHRREADFGGTVLNSNFLYSGTQYEIPAPPSRLARPREGGAARLWAARAVNTITEAGEAKADGD